MNNPRFKASSNPIKAIIDLGHNERVIRREFAGQRKNRISILYWIIIAVIFLPMIIGAFSNDEPYGRYMLFILFGFLVLVSVLYLLVFLRVRKNSPIFRVRAIYFSSDKGFELEYKNNVREFIAYKNVSELILKSNFDKQLGQIALWFASPLAWIFLSPKTLEWITINHFSLVVKEGKNKREISIPFDIFHIYEAIKLVKDNSHIETPMVQGAKILASINKPLSPKNILIASIAIVFIIAILVGPLAYLEWKSKRSMSESPKPTITESQSVGPIKTDETNEIINGETYDNLFRFEDLQLGRVFGTMTLTDLREHDSATPLLPFSEDSFIAEFSGQVTITGEYSDFAYIRVVYFHPDEASLNLLPIKSGVDVSRFVMVFANADIAEEMFQKYAKRSGVAEVVIDNYQYRHRTGSTPVAKALLVKIIHIFE